MAKTKPKRKKSGATAGSAMPLYHQTYLVVRQRLQEGFYTADEPLPSEEEFRQEFGVSRVTVRRALAELEREGLIRRRRGSGTYPVAEALAGPSRSNISGLYENLITLGLNAEAKLLVFETVATPALIRKLDKDFGDEVLHIVRVRRLNKEPFSYMSSYIPAAFKPLFKKAELGNQPLLMTLEMAGTVAATAEQSLTATSADVEIAKALKVPVGSPLINMKRLSRDEENRPIEYFESWYRPDRFEYRMTLSRIQSSEAPHWKPID